MSVRIIDTKNTVGKRRAFYTTKRIFDFIGSGVALFFLLPLFLIVAVLIKLSSPGSVFYKQYRVGFKGNPLYIIKFRTMVSGADKMIDLLSKEQQEEYYRNYKLEKDPRVTKIGAILRKSSVDELPQLVNIFKGEMSFVGPRPIVDAELERYGNEKGKFLSVKPGLTGYWACHGRSDVSYEDRMKLELYYVDHASLSLDLLILLKTIKAVFAQDGAR